MKWVLLSSSLDHPSPLRNLAVLECMSAFVYANAAVLWQASNFFFVCAVIVNNWCIFLLWFNIQDLYIIPRKVFVQLFICWLMISPRCRYKWTCSNKTPFRFRCGLSVEILTVYFVFVVLKDRDQVFIHEFNLCTSRVIFTKHIWTSSITKGRGSLGMELWGLQLKYYLLKYSILHHLKLHLFCGLKLIIR